ncbi:MAG: DEAD/DEAH box helicase family protein [Candidatus Moranbacteria bacterium]|nr:DEAD/DEAH box helicase family protein [Candidatus Moranbacteria bacterium]
MLTPSQKIQIFKHLFRGREDVFAMRWEKQDKSASGYTPVCLNEWKRGLCNKLLRKRCKDCGYKEYTQLNDRYIEKHLVGNRVYGIYPLLEDNSSYFLAADFDGNDWKNNAITYLKKCLEYNLPAYLERSRSGNGGHVWIFFENNYPTCKSRNIGLNILREAKIIDQFSKEDAFDRLFPNQDNLSGEGFGNLIALPLQGYSRKSGNTVFLDWENDFEPYADQWNFLEEVKKVSEKTLDCLYSKFNGETKSIKKSNQKSLTITVREQILIDKNKLPRIVVNFLRDELNFFNLEYTIRKKMGINVHKVEKYFKLVEDIDDKIAIPRGFLQKLMDFLSEQDIAFKIIDERTKLKNLKFEKSHELFDYQEKAIKQILVSENGLLVAPPGSGKTIMGIDIIAKLRQPTLILVHKKQIFNQWVERIEGFLNISKKDIGQFVSTKKKISSKITVAMVQTLNRLGNLNELTDKFGLVIVDECHHMPAKMFRNIITKLNPYYLYGFTATPERKNNDEKLIYIYLGEVLHTIDTNYNQPKNTKSKTEVIIRETNLEIPFKVKVDNFQTLYKIISFDSERNRSIIEDIKKEADKGFKCLVLTERKDHADVLSHYLKKDYEIIQLTGDLTAKQRKEKIQQIYDGNFQILLATGQLIGEGTDFPNLDCLFLIFPFAFQGKLTQYIGRVQRGKNKQIKIYDYRDKKVEYLERLFKKRLKYYQKNFGLKLTKENHE